MSKTILNNSCGDLQLTALNDICGGLRVNHHKNINISRFSSNATNHFIIENLKFFY